MHVGFVGLGNIGFPMAHSLHTADVDVIGYDLNPLAAERLAQHDIPAAGSVAELARACEIVFVSVPDAASLSAVINGPAGLLDPGTTVRIVVNTSTVGVAGLRAAQADLTPHGIELVDCPVSGGPPALESRTLTTIVSGRESALETVLPLLAHWGPSIVVGDRPGDAQIVKLINNILSAVALTATSEALVAGAKAGIDPALLLRAVNMSSGRNTATEVKFPAQVLPRTFAWGASMAILDKDVRLAMGLATDVSVSMPVCAAAALTIAELVESAPGADVTNLVRNIERQAGFEVPRVGAPAPDAAVGPTPK